MLLRTVSLLVSLQTLCAAELLGGCRTSKISSLLSASLFVTVLCNTLDLSATAYGSRSVFADVAMVCMLHRPVLQYAERRKIGVTKFLLGCLLCCLPGDTS